MRYVVEKANAALAGPVAWGDSALMKSAGLRGNRAAPAVPFDIGKGKTLREAVFAPLPAFQVHDKARGRVVGDAWLIPAVDLPLSAARAETKRRATDLFRTKSVLGVTVGGAAIATNNDAVQEIREVVAEVKDGSTLGVVTRGGSKVDFDTATAAATLAAVLVYRKACFMRERALFDAIDAALDIAALRAIDLDAGWPA